MTRRSSRLSQKNTDSTARETVLKKEIQPTILSSDEESIDSGITLPSTPRKKKSTDTDDEFLSPPTPPKLKKITESEICTPKGKKPPNDENSHRTPKTPSSLMTKLSISTPGGRTNRRSLFNGKDSFRAARRSLHSTVPTEMPGREKELEELRSFIKENLNNKTSSSLYISGPPGTGKTASLNLVLNDSNIRSQFKDVFINCTSIKSSGSIYSKIAQELDLKTSGRAEKDYLAAIEAHLTKSHKMILLVLDEIDQLDSKKQSILYTIFEWPSRPNSKLILIGIANALDLTDRTLPRLQARCELKPKLMHFAPYTKQQIVDIFTSRLREGAVLETFSPAALQMLAAKVSSVSGDVRRALDIGRRVVELCDQNSDDILRPLENLSNELTETETKTVELKQVVNVLNNVYGTSQNLAEDADEAFPLQQKVVICSLLLFLKKANQKDVTVGKLHDIYKRVCSKRNLVAVDQAEFVSLCSLIETRGLIRVSGKKEPRLHKVTLEWDEEEVVSALKDKKLMSAILQDDIGKF